MSSPCGTNNFISGLKFISMNINSIRGKKNGTAVSQWGKKSALKSK